jgi:hypothetical protein
MPNVHLIKNHGRYFLGKPKIIFAFRNAFDANIVRKNISFHEPLSCHQFSQKLTFVEKNIMNDSDQKHVFLDVIQSTSICKKAKLNGMRIKLVNAIIEKEKYMVFIGHDLDVEREYELEDFQLNLDYIFMSN